METVLFNGNIHTLDRKRLRLLSAAGSSALSAAMKTFSKPQRRTRNGLISRADSFCPALPTPICIFFITLP